MELTRRTTLLGLAATAAVGTSAPKPVALSNLRPPALPDWLATELRNGRLLPAILQMASAEAAKRCALDVDLHPLLLAGPATRIGPTPELVLWVLFQVTQLEPATCRHTTVAPLPADLLRRVASDAHPWIAAREAPDLPGLAAAIEGEALPLSKPGSEAEAPARVARRIRDGEGLTHLDETSLWNGLWVAAAQLQAGMGGPLNGTHCLTLTASVAAQAKGEERFTAALAVVERVRRFGPVLLEADLAPRPMTAEQWRSLGRNPGADVHDLKLAEAVLAAPTAVAEQVRAYASASNHATPGEPDPRFVPLLARFGELRRK